MSETRDIALYRLRHAYKPDLRGLERPFLVDWYESYAEAMEDAKAYDSKPYVLMHGEYSPPTYVIVDAQVADYIESGRYEDMSNYDWDDAECTCGECNKCIQMMIEQDREYILDHAMTVIN